MSSLQPFGNLEGYQSGEHFGASLAVADTNGDGRDDVIIGAPFYTDYSDPELKYEIGSVYVYYQTSFGRFSRGKPNELILRGKTAGGRFGSAVANLGDTNLDGFNDIAVGAPYDQSGMVYIFHGSESGVRKRPSQIISGDRFQPPLSSFGSSLTSGADLDANHYNDLMVGAYKNDSVVFLPARPVIKMTIGLSFSPEHIALETKDCQMETKDNQTIAVSCSSIQYCFLYKGVGVSDTISVNVAISLDVKQPKTTRLFFLDTSASKLSQVSLVNRGETLCQRRKVYVRPDVRDKLSPMEADMVVSLVDDLRPPYPPVLDAFMATNVSSTLSIYRDCGKDSICYPDLQLKAAMYVALRVTLGHVT